MSLAVDIDNETVIMTATNTIHMTVMNRYALQRRQHWSMLDAERVRRRHREEADDARDRAIAQTKAAQQEPQTLLAEHRQWNARRDAFKGGWKHFG